MASRREQLLSKAPLLRPAWGWQLKELWYNSSQTKDTAPGRHPETCPAGCPMELSKICICMHIAEPTNSEASSLYAWKSFELPILSAVMKGLEGKCRELNESLMAKHNDSQLGPGRHNGMLCAKPYSQNKRQKRRIAFDCLALTVQVNSASPPKVCMQRVSRTLLTRKSLKSGTKDCRRNPDLTAVQSTNTYQPIPYALGSCREESETFQRASVRDFLLQLRSVGQQTYIQDRKHCRELTAEEHLDLHQGYERWQQQRSISRIPPASAPPVSPQQEHLQLPTRVGQSLLLARGTRPLCKHSQTQIFAGTKKSKTSSQSLFLGCKFGLMSIFPLVLVIEEILWVLRSPSLLTFPSYSYTRQKDYMIVEQQAGRPAYITEHYCSALLLQRELRHCSDWLYRLQCDGLLGPGPLTIGVKKDNRSLEGLKCANGAAPTGFRFCSKHKLPEVKLISTTLASSTTEPRARAEQRDRQQLPGFSKVREHRKKHNVNRNRLKKAIGWVLGGDEGMSYEQDLKGAWMPGFARNGIKQDRAELQLP
ncbi:hypothetical protein Anapl_09467 [Anas platyrhynchos]|uniref:Uncharacterized protein n=1 Tax=Anas platyrhynchos TaxID=8839 RepID=R0LAA4_ANAPL|nr:hypothetical protein Anapl_09467 [Anas platyrhynchos]